MSDLQDWIDIRIYGIVKETEARRREGEQKRQIFREKMEEIKERYERLMERKIQRMRQDGIDITLEEFRNRPTIEETKKLRTLEEEEYINLFGQGVSDSALGQSVSDSADGSKKPATADVLFGGSESDSDREVVDCEIYGITNPVKSESERKELDLSILRPVKKDTGISNPLNIIRPVINETDVEEPEASELGPITEENTGSVKTIKLKVKPKKHFKPRPTRANSQTNLRKLFSSDAGDESATSNGNAAFLESFLRQNSSGHLAPSDPKEKLRRGSAKLRAIKAFVETRPSDSKTELHSSGEPESKKKLPTRTESSGSISNAKKGLLKKKSSKLIVQQDSLKYLLQNKHK